MPMLPLSQIKVGDRYRKELGNIDELAQSIGDIGLLQPLVVNAENELVAGGRRLAAVTKLGWAEVPVVVFTGDELVGQERENTDRKGFTTSERTAIAEAIKKRVRDKKVTLPEGADVNEYAAEQAGFDSARQLHRANRVVKDGMPELVEAMDAGDVSIAAAEQLVTLPPAEQVAAVKTGKGKEKAAEVRKTKPSSKSDKPAEPVKKEKEKADDNTVQVDGLGKPVPDCVADVFFDPSLNTLLCEIDSLETDLKRLIGRIREVGNKAAYLPHCGFGEAMQSVERGVKEVRAARSQIAVGKPFVVCDGCGGKGCGKCIHVGYLTQHMYENGDQYGD